MQIIMTGRAGDRGSYKLAVSNMDLMESRFSAAFIKSFEKLNVSGESFDGLYRQLWRLGCEAGAGLEVYHDAVPIAQETIEICELLEVNPYEIETSGRLYLAEESAVITEGTVIGRLTKARARVIVSKYGNRFLTKA